RPLAGRPITAAAACFNAHAVVWVEPEPFLLFDRPLGAVSTDERKASGPPFLSALCAPWRKAGAVKVGLQRTGLQHAVGLAKAQATTEFSRACAILPQREFFKTHRQICFLQFKRNDARIAMRHGAERPGAVVGRTGAPAAVAAVVAREIAAVRPAAMEVHARVSAEMAARHALGYCLLQRLDDGIDDGGKRR